MIETVIINYLSSVLSIPVVMEEPEQQLETFVLIERTGGGEENKIKSATVAIQSYASSLYAAATLNESVKSAMSEITTLDGVSACYLNADYNYTDTIEKRYRYQAVFDIFY